MPRTTIYPNPIIGRNLRRLCAEKNITATQLAGACGKERKSAYNWWNSATSPNADDLIAICLKYHVSADELLGLKREVNNNG